jgi:CBS domain-containing protein
MDTVRSILANKGPAIWSIAPEASVYDALQLLAEKDIGALVVVSEGRAVGVFSERDYARKVILAGRTSRELLVREVMTSPVITVAQDHSVEECMRVMTSHHIRHLPVLDGTRLAGVVSIGDLVNAIISTQADTIQHLSNYISGSGNYPA